MTGLYVSRLDKQHYHHVLMRLVVLITDKKIGQKEVNPIGSFFAWHLTMIACALEYHLNGDKGTFEVAIVAFTDPYVVTYHLLVNNELKLRSLIC